MSKYDFPTQFEKWKTKKKKKKNENQTNFSLLAKPLINMEMIFCWNNRISPEKKNQIDIDVVVLFSKSNYMCKFLICHYMLGSECLLLLNINFVNSGKECKKAIIFLMSLLNYIEEENFDKNNENLKYLNNISGNLLQIFEGKDITSNQETNVKFFMSETVCHFFIFFYFCYAGRNKIFSSANIHQFGLLKYFCQK